MIYILSIGGISVLLGSYYLLPQIQYCPLNVGLIKFIWQIQHLCSRVPFGLGLFAAAIFIIYSLINESTEYLIIIGVLALVFSLMLLLTPKAIFSLERQANRVYMTDPTFMKYRDPFGLFLSPEHLWYTLPLVIFKKTERIFWNCLNQVV